MTIMLTSTPALSKSQHLLSERVKALFYAATVFDPLIILFCLLWALSVARDWRPVESLIWVGVVLLSSAIHFIYVRRSLAKADFVRHYVRLEHQFATVVVLGAVIWCLGFIMYTPNAEQSHATSLYIFSFFMLLFFSVRFAGSALLFKLLFTLIGSTLVGTIYFSFSGDLLIMSVALLALSFIWQNFKLQHRQLLLRISDKVARSELAQELQQANAELKKLARLDGLTQLGNRHYFDQCFTVLLSHHFRASQPVSLLLLDIDYFKSYNDTLGHVAGDQCLTKVAALLKQACLRPDDQAFRYGGEEFAILLGGTHQQGALKIAERIHLLLRDANLSHPSSQVAGYVSVSIGVVSCVPHIDTSSQSLLLQADKALYQAKDNGRNQSYCFQ